VAQDAPGDRCRHAGHADPVSQWKKQLWKEASELSAREKDQAKREPGLMAREGELVPQMAKGSKIGWRGLKKKVTARV